MNTNRFRSKQAPASELRPRALVASLAALAFGCSLASGCASSGTDARAADPARPDAAECPVVGAAAQPAARSKDPWWPNRLDLSALYRDPRAGDPLGEDFDYAAEFASLDLAAVKRDIASILTSSQDWWPADYGHYGPLMIRLAWHSAGTYRTIDGRGGSASGSIRFAPLNSWPDNGNLDKARRLLWPIKAKYGRKLSWADLIVLSGNVALESMGFTTFGFAGGREDVYEPELVDWGPETEWLADQRFGPGRELSHPLAASQMGLIYVNPEGPNGRADPLAAAKDIRITFSRMAMDDEETVALIAGGHTLGKAHGAADPKRWVGPPPEGAPLEEQGLGWKNAFGSGKGADTITSGLEGAWTSTPIDWSHEYFQNLFRYDWELTKSPAGAQQWIPKGAVRPDVPDAHVAGKRHLPIMLTTDLALKVDPIYAPIARRFRENPKDFEAAFARAWFKLTHRDMGPHARLVGTEVPPPQLWQDPVSPVDHELVGPQDVADLKQRILALGLPIPQLVRAAWASAASFRGTDLRGGANGARVRLAPQKDWEVNDPAELATTLAALEKLQGEFNGGQGGGRRISLADLIVLAGCAAVEEAAKRGGHAIAVPFRPGRTDASAAMTDAASFAVLEPRADGFRNHLGKASDRPAPELLVERAALLTLTAPEMTVLVGGLRSLDANAKGSRLGVLTERPGTLGNAFFVHLLDPSTAWRRSAADPQVYEGVDRKTGAVRWTASAVDLVFGSDSQLRAIAEVYAAADAERVFVEDFVAAWTKVMELDRFDL
ncbi:MAG: catalase/peroxidase HPI [Planctomycetes bacterium]|nr:catalase/peroxidase HPI [Planctomycetota bacterium]